MHNERTMSFFPDHSVSSTHHSIMAPGRHCISDEQMHRNARQTHLLAFSKCTSQGQPHKSWQVRHNPIHFLKKEEPYLGSSDSDPRCEVTALKFYYPIKSAV